ncbi:hypothetical protein MAPG_07469 [Magnaporthiopsis poae ATCC 64411]|uniref:CCZ1/INTU/HSP4 first Longin domain-containing protein n=1 Tax=Magnaporthiopsis poae (strain ATCC 64411 / 73-15) TaxID=644358 RepID=A0A0C4E4R9_MAGP6|nr:hypothetical protein MAPG_07469 [Magnaporthiopsis poae ATCC 64411]
MASPASSIVPAQLGFLAIYNPTLGATDDTIEDQIVYYASVGTPQPGRRRRARNRPISTVSQEERNERLRQIGLAQGMVEFGRSFSGDRPVDTVETDKSRVIMHELEPGWWILASVDLTKLPAPKGKQASSGSKGKGADANSADAEYSSREVKPAALLLQDLMRAHSVFLLHHDSSLSSLFVRTKRTKFSLLLGRYWDMFLSTWNVMLHGNPIVNVFGGIKVAASGELGIGVGEEERGSGEREVLEGLVGRIEGLVDLVVSKFGDYDPQGPAEAEPAATTTASNRDPTQPLDMWLGTGAEPAAEDGAIFLGTGALSRHSLRDLTHWMEDIYSFGENAYGVRESATSTRRTKARRKSTAHKQTLEPVLLPPPPVTELARRAKQASPTRKSSSKTQEQRAGASSPAVGSAGAAVQDGPDSTGMAKYVDYLKMGYGKYWSIGSTATAEPAEEQVAGTGASDSALAPPETAASGAPTPKEPPFQDESSGHYLIGLMGNVEGTAGTSEEDSVATEDPEHNSRTLLRTVTVELDSPELERSESQTMKDLGSHDTELFQTTSGDDDPARTASSSGTSRTTSLTVANGGGARRESFNSQDRNKTHKLRIVVYVNRPFMFAFLFPYPAPPPVAWLHIVPAREARR